MAMVTPSARGNGAAARWHPLREIGGGPWRVLPNCPAFKHNTLKSARGMVMCGNERSKEGACICPRACFLLKEFRKQEKARETKKGNGFVYRSIETAHYMNNTATDFPPPDLTLGACKSLLGRRLTDKVIAGHKGADDLFKNTLCFAGCPVLMQCRAWVRRDEKPVGDWLGVYGGLSQSERRAS